jgi:hypothetical protein
MIFLLMREELELRELGQVLGWAIGEEGLLVRLDDHCHLSHLHRDHLV